MTETVTVQFPELPQHLKEKLELRAAQSGSGVEDEVRKILIATARVGDSSPEQAVAASEAEDTRN